MPLVRSSGSRALRIGGFAASLVAVAAMLAPVAAAQTSSESSGAGALRAQADELSSRYFSALERVQTLDNDIARNEQSVTDLAARAKMARHNARARALVAYTMSGTQLSALIDGDNSLDTARRAHLIDQVNAHDHSVFAKLRAATRELHKQQRILRDTRLAQADALSELRDQGAAINAKLAQAEQQEQVARARAVVATPDSTTTTGAPQTSVTSQSTAAPSPAPSTTTTTTTTAPPITPQPPPDYTPTPGTSPHHDDPFLTCVRKRESGGNYSAVNPAGPYLGAYQFLQTTWNLTASHAGKLALVGVPANVASPYDQDEIAWALYQWQGKAPWGGACP